MSSRPCSSHHLRQDREGSVDLGRARRRAAARGAGRSRPRSGRRGRRRARPRRRARQGRPARRRRAVRRRAPRRRPGGRRGRRSGERPLSRTDASSASSIVSRTAPAAAQMTGLPPKVEAWSPTSKPAGASSATSRQPIGSPFASPFASVTSCGRTPSCSQAKNEPVRPTPVCTSSKARSAPSSAASSAAAARNSGVERDDAALAEHRLEQDQADVAGRRGAQRGDVVRLREASARQQRLEPGALRGLAGDGERAGRAAVEAPLERDHAGLAGRLARVLERRLVRLGARVAEERTGTGGFAYRRSQPRSGWRASRQAKAPARSRRGSRRARAGRAARARRRAAPDGGARARRRRSRREVEVAAAVGVGQPDALAVDERDRRGRIDGQQRAPGHRAHASTAVTPISATSPPLAACTAASSFGTMPPSKTPSPISASACAARISESSSPLVEHARHVGEEEQPLGAEPDGERRGGLVGVHVQRPATATQAAVSACETSASGVTTGTRPAASAALTAGGEAAGLSRRARARGRRPRQADLVALERNGVRADRGADGGVDRQPGSRARPRAPRRVVYAPAADELHLDPAPRHLLGDLRPGAVDDADLRRLRRGASRPRRATPRGRRTADLQDKAVTSGTPR